ncbi:hypothetical protein P171DRAFT_441973 [Karstenula rhodostoma CBS 690.94]|uniref:Uncharacterized protein n=1 Tax=Karstenula rhodostoma CBS 690.94 TaxID=1392251 RepID=A0A9P4PPW2_9PLEO|nr:hypothetical protein P171DRAFT_441973 [Karstenula rhodostoma CBS 690.94]
MTTPEHVPNGAGYVLPPSGLVYQGLLLGTEYLRVDWACKWGDSLPRPGKPQRNGCRQQRARTPEAALAERRKSTVLHGFERESEAQDAARADDAALGTRPEGTRHNSPMVLVSDPKAVAHRIQRGASPVVSFRCAPFATNTHAAGTLSSYHVALRRTNWPLSPTHRTSEDRNRNFESHKHEGTFGEKHRAKFVGTCTRQE